MQENFYFTEKILYRVAKFMHLYLGYDIVNENYKLLWKDKIEILTKQEIAIKNFMDSFKYLNNNLTARITDRTLIKSYFLLSGRRISLKKLDKILVEYYSQHEKSAYVNATIIHKIILQTTLPRKVEYATLLSNFVLMASKKCPFIIFQSEAKKYTEAKRKITEDQTLMHNFIMSSSLFMGASNESIEKNKLVLTKEEILSKIYELKDHIHSQYRIKSMYLYGSVNTNLADEYSDIDMLVVFREEIPIYQKYSLLDDCRLDLEKTLEAKIDLVEIYQAISIFGTRGIKKSTKIF